jgi:hypothetical protein
MMYLSSALLRTYFTSAHKRKEMEVILRNRLPKKTGVKDPVIVPKPSTITSGPFSILPSFLESEALLQVMLYAIFNVKELHRLGPDRDFQARSGSSAASSQSPEPCCTST